MKRKVATIGQLLAARAAAGGNLAALSSADGDKVYSYRELDKKADEVAKGLLALGVSRGDNVAVWALNTPEWLFVQFGCAKIGAAAVALNTSYRKYELEYVLKQSDVTTLFLIDGAAKKGEYLSVIREICPEVGACRPDETREAGLPKLKNLIFLGQEKQSGMFSWEEFLALAGQVSDGDLAEQCQAVEADDIFTIQFTSGTTGFPKGAMLTHGNYISNAFAVAERQRLTAEDKVCVPLPFFHAYGCITIMSAVAAGAAVVPLEKFRAIDLLQAIETCRCTAVSGTPTMFVAALQEMNNRSYNLSSLRGGNMAGANCPEELVKAVVEKMGAREFGILYGSTEGIISIMNPPDATLFQRATTLGTAMPEFDLKIIDPQTGEQVAGNGQGELCLKGPAVLKGYYNMPEATARTIDKDGWLHSGDLAWIDETGFCRITGRIKDVIIRGGENVYPAEIEEFLFSHPKVMDVQVVGVPCRYYGEDVVAFVRLKAGETATGIELKRYCREQIAINKVPAQFIFVDTYPQTASGKVQKFKLRETAARIMQNG